MKPASLKAIINSHLLKLARESQAKTDPVTEDILLESPGFCSHPPPAFSPPLQPPRRGHTHTLPPPGPRLGTRGFLPLLAFPSCVTDLPTGPRGQNGGKGEGLWSAGQKNSWNIKESLAGILNC